MLKMLSKCRGSAHLLTLRSRVSGWHHSLNLAFHSIPPSWCMSSWKIIFALTVKDVSNPSKSQMELMTLRIRLLGIIWHIYPDKVILLMYKVPLGLIRNSGSFSVSIGEQMMYIQYPSLPQINVVVRKGTANWVRSPSSPKRRLSSLVLAYCIY